MALLDLHQTSSRGGEIIWGCAEPTLKGLLRQLCCHEMPWLTVLTLNLTHHLLLHTHTRSVEKPAVLNYVSELNSSWVKN